MSILSSKTLKDSLKKDYSSRALSRLAGVAGKLLSASPGASDCHGISSTLASLSRKGAKKKNPVPTHGALAPARALSQQQTPAWRQVRSHSGFSAHLLHGVTPDLVKPKFYLHLLEQVLERGQKASVLVPENFANPAVITLLARFPGKIAVIHSHLTDREENRSMVGK